MMKSGLTLLFLTLIILGKSNAQSPVVDYKARISQIDQNINKVFYEPETGLYKETNAKNDKPHSYLWPLCALIQAANEAEQLDPGKAHMKPVLRAISQYHNDNPPAPGYQAYVTKEGKDARFYDDNQWIAIACLDAYNRTKSKSYLRIAEEIYRFQMTGFDEKAGGGLYWKEDEKNTKNTCSNGPGILVALQLYKITKKKEYLTTAVQLYEWTNKHLRGENGIFYDAIKIPSLKIDSAKYTYNTGTMLQSNVLLYVITKEKKYLEEAQLIAGSAEKYFYRNNKLPDHYWFNVVLLRGYEALYEVDRNKKQLQFFFDDAERIWKNEKDGTDLVGTKQTKTLIDQSAMMEMYGRLERLK
ncbi:glycoside hydrolase family 76 protein [Dyadobacter sp. LHD-138]|uniref:glycoside hydrolase family 76 protein n=1 Tax=Dyadobacter sp. LHD-138 TaxID=3071413 RepID=UPI0027DFC552|nr:glycoside hydrolase family 76 protein [Dyadobacter sp. LHD-138]MDQ6477462.1 glycoside hydrolase family 76 protein [Dyadobacter sp. LHD-138]